MADAFLRLPVTSRREALSVAADQSGRPAHLLEKDVWVVWALAALYGSALGEHLVFKGGTSLSKAYGVIAVVSPEAVGRPLMMLVAVTLERERADIIDRFKQAIRKTREIMSGYYVTGEADFMLIVSARDMADYEVFTRRFFYENADIKSFKTMVVMDRVKASFAVPMDLD